MELQHLKLFWSVCVREHQAGVPTRVIWELAGHGGPADQHVANSSQFAQHFFSFSTRYSVFLEPGETTLALVLFLEVSIQCSGVGPGNLPFYQISLVTLLCTKVWESS